MMKRFATYLLSATVLFSAGSLFGETVEAQEDLLDDDYQALRDWVRSKRQVTVKEIGGNLSISGDVRFIFEATDEYIANNGDASINRTQQVPQRGYRVAFNLMLDYRTDRTWASSKVEFSNRAGVRSGTDYKIRLSRAYIGGRAIDGDTILFDIEFGRRPMSSIYDSKLQFRGLYDGVVFKLSMNSQKVGTFYTNIGSFVINDLHDVYGFVGEMGLLDVGNTGYYGKYSFIAWNLKKAENAIQTQNFDFAISQMILGYRATWDRIGQIVNFYLGGLCNHSARRVVQTGNTKQQFGFWGGFSVGQLKKHGDWSFEANYQYLQAQGVPSFNVAGIGLGNSVNSGFYSVNSSLDAPGANTVQSNAMGNTNYHGYLLQWNWLATAALNIQNQWKQSWSLNRNIGPKRTYLQYELDLIYAF